MHIYPTAPNSFEPFFCTATFHSFPPSIGSSLPQDSCVFQWDRNTVAVRYHSRCVARWWAGRRHGRVVNVAARRAGQLANARHLLPHRSTAHDAVGVKLYPHRLGVEVAKINLNVKDVLFATSFNLHLAKV